MKITNIDREVLHIFLRNFNEIFRKDVTYDSIKSHKKPVLNPFFRKCIFRITTGGGSN